MQLKYLHHLDGLTLKNVNEKLQNLRDHLREATNRDAEYIRYKITGEHTKEMGVKDNIPDHSSSQDPANAEVSNKYNNSGSPIDPRNQLVQANESNADPVQKLPIYFRNVKLINSDLDFDEVKRVNMKKISAQQLRQYIKYILPEEVEEKMKEVWDLLEDDKAEVEVKDFVRRINKLGVHFNEAPAFNIPLIKKTINLKKVLFQIAYKESDFPDKIKWEDFQSTLKYFWHPNEPTIDQLMNKLKSQGAKLARNYFHIPPEVIYELKSIFKKCFVDHFYGYCSVEALIAKMHTSIVLQRYLKTDVRPKSHNQVALSLKDTIQYIRIKAPLFIDLDQFLLYFSANCYAYYPIEEQQCLQDDSTIHKKDSKLNRIKSAKDIKPKKSPSPKRIVFNEYRLSYCSPKSKRRQKFVEQVIEKQQEVETFKFKAKPYSKEKTDEKYRQFLSVLESKKKEGRQKQMEKLRKSQKEIERLKSETKLFKMPQHPSSQQKKAVFTSRPAPEICKSPRLQEIEAEKSQRRNKIFSLTQEKYKNSWQWLPQAMKKQSPKKPEVIFKPEYYKQSHEVPDYRAEQQRMKHELEIRKMYFKPTEIQQFYLHTQQRHPQKHQTVRVETVPNQPSYDYKQILYAPAPDIYYTQKFTEMVTANKNYAQKRELSLNERQMQDEQRRKKHKNFAKFMKEPLSKLPNTGKILEMEAKNKIQKHKQYWKNLDLEYEQGLNEIYSKVIKRPFLYELQSTYSKPKQVYFAPAPPKKKPKKKKQQPPAPVSQAHNNSF